MSAPQEIEIHPTAIVAPGAQLGVGSRVGPYAVIGPEVALGRGTIIGPHVVIEGRTRGGDQNQFFPFCSIGGRPQDLKYHGEESVLELGHRNIIREYVTLQPGTKGGGMLTKIGSENLFMAGTHVGHDCVVGDGNVFANLASLAGHVTVGSFATLGGLSAVHQFTRVGSLAFIGGGSMVVQDAPPFCIVQGDRAKLYGVNKIGLQRRGFTEGVVKDLHRLYKRLFLGAEGGAGTLKDRLDLLEAEYADQGGEGATAIKELLSFVRSSARGVTPPPREEPIEKAD